MNLRAFASVLALLVAAATPGFQPASAQDKGTLNPRPLPALAHPAAPSTPAKELFGRAREPANLEARSIGFYSRGCLAGGEALPVNGEAWQVMRLSRNRNWGHPRLIALLERFATEVQKEDGWPGLLVGDISQPRGGPMRRDGRRRPCTLGPAAAPFACASGCAYCGAQPARRVTATRYNRWAR